MDTIKSYLPKSYRQDGSEIILTGEKKLEGHMEIQGNVKIIPKCHERQRPYQRGNKLGCYDDLEEKIE